MHFLRATGPVVSCPGPSSAIIGSAALRSVALPMEAGWRETAVYSLCPSSACLSSKAKNSQRPAGPLEAPSQLWKPALQTHAGLSPERGTAGHSGLAGSPEASPWTERDRWRPSTHPSPGSHWHLAVQRCMAADGHGRRRSACLLHSLSGSARRGVGLEIGKA